MTYFPKDNMTLILSYCGYSYRERFEHLIATFKDFVKVNHGDDEDTRPRRYIKETKTLYFTDCADNRKEDLAEYYGLTSAPQTHPNIGSKSIRNMKKGIELLGMRYNFDGDFDKEGMGMNFEANSLLLKNHLYDLDDENYDGSLFCLCDETGFEQEDVALHGQTMTEYHIEDTQGKADAFRTSRLLKEYEDEDRVVCFGCYEPYTPEWERGGKCTCYPDDSDDDDEVEQKRIREADEKTARREHLLVECAEKGCKNSIHCKEIRCYECYLRRL